MSYARQGYKATRSLDIDPTATLIVAGGTGRTSHRLHGWVVCNETAAIAYLKFYNKATAATEADTPVITVGVPPNSGGEVVEISHGLELFPLGMYVRCTTAIADNSTADPGANKVHGFFMYK